MSSIPEVRAEKLAAGGDALAHLADGRVVFVQGALPGESCDRSTASQAGLRRAVLESSTVAVSSRGTVPRRAGGCGGCNWQHVEPGGGVAMKTGRRRGAAGRIGKLANPDVRAGGRSRRGITAQRCDWRPGSGVSGLRAGTPRRRRDPRCPVSTPRLQRVARRGAGSRDRRVRLRVGAATGDRTALVVEDGVALVDIARRVAVGADAGCTR